MRNVRTTARGNGIWHPPMRADDHRRSCYCGHRYRDHGPAHGTKEFGGKCLAWVNDPQKSSLYLCSCERWQP